MVPEPRAGHDESVTRDADVSRGVMAGDGYYDRHSATQQGAAAIRLDLLRAAISEADLNAAPTLRVADLGCAQGQNSLAPMAVVVDAIRQRSAADIDIVHTDLPGNDWTSLFEVIEHDPGSYLVGHEADVHPPVDGRSFYEDLFVRATLTAAWTSSSLHWLGASPGAVADDFFAQSSTDHAAIERYRAQAAADWTDFLVRRCVELAPSASVVFVNVLMGDDGTMGPEALFDTLEQSLRAARSAGTVTAEEYAAMTYPAWFRTQGELRAPFSPVLAGPGGEGRGGEELELVALEPTILADPFLSAWEGPGDAATYGRQQAGFLRGFPRTKLRNCVDGAWGRAAHRHPQPGLHRRRAPNCCGPALRVARVQTGRRPNSPNRLTPTSVPGFG